MHEDLERRDILLEERSKNVLTVAPLIREREALVTEAISEETGLSNLAHYQDPIVIRDFATLTDEQTNYIRERGDGNVYGGDTFIGQRIFGVDDNDLSEDVEKLIERIKDSPSYKFFVATVSNQIEDKERLRTNPVYHDFVDKFKTIEDIEKAVTLVEKHRNLLDAALSATTESPNNIEANEDFSQSRKR